MPTIRPLIRSGSIAAIPGRRFGAPKSNINGQLTVASRPFRSPSFSLYNATIVGATMDSASSPLAGCTVQLFRTVDDAFIAETISDGSGNYVLTPTVSGPFYVVAYKAGSPDVAGTTVNTLTAA
jgi:hypothetical protein